MLTKWCALTLVLLGQMTASPEKASSQSSPSLDSKPSAAGGSDAQASKLPSTEAVQQNTTKGTSSANEQLEAGLNAFQVLMKEIPADTNQEASQTVPAPAVPPLPMPQIGKDSRATDQDATQLPDSAVAAPEASVSSNSFETITGPAAAVEGGAALKINGTTAGSGTQPEQGSTSNSAGPNKSQEQDHVARQGASATTQTASQTAKTSDSLLLELAQTDSASFWKSAAATLGFLLATALLGLQILRSRKGGMGSHKSNAKALELLATLPIGPKRQILLIKVRESEIAVASTEHGVSLLTETQRNIHTRSMLAASDLPNLALPQPGSQSQASDQSITSGAGRILSHVGARKKSEIQPASGAPEAKSDILRKAIETIETRRAKPSSILPQNETNLESSAPKFKKHASNSYAQIGQQSADTESPVREGTIGNVKLGSTLAGRSAQAGRAHAELERDATLHSSARGQQTQQRGSLNEGGQAEHAQTDNVAQLIREKLKQMKALNS